MQSLHGDEQGLTSYRRGEGKQAPAHRELFFEPGLNHYRRDKAGHDLRVPESTEIILSTGIELLTMCG
jgi:hypothetical protein